MEKGPGFSRIIRKIRVSGLILKTPEIRELKARKKARINFSLPGCQTLTLGRPGKAWEGLGMPGNALWEGLGMPGNALWEGLGRPGNAWECTLGRVCNPGIRE